MFKPTLKNMMQKTGNDGISDGGNAPFGVRVAQWRNCVYGIGLIMDLLLCCVVLCCV